MKTPKGKVTSQYEHKRLSPKSAVSPVEFPPSPGGEFNSRSQVPDEHLSAHSYKEVCNVSDLPWVDLS